MNKNTDIALTVVIVNYNVAYFLEQCLNAALKNSSHLNTEIIVVDNRSSDGSISMLKEKFPHIKRIENQENVGFAKANNQGIKQAKGAFILLLNPDTVVEENTFEKIVEKMKSDPTIGGLGVRMVDGKGAFLPESKRSLPTPKVAFYKIFGLSNLFPKSKVFGRYHLSYLNELETHDVEVLSGAFMCVRADVFKKIGLLDEAFFMYGEDIDLSYRILLAGFKNVYFPETNIIHYKGESTKKSSVNYVFIFYKAMVIFAKKHFSQKHALLFSILIYGGIFFRASLAILNRVFKVIIPPIWSASIILLGLYGMTYQWREYDIAFPSIAFTILIPMYFTIWSLVGLLGGAFDKPFKTLRLAKTVSIGTLIILVVYALLPKEYQFSRLFIILGGVWYFTATILDKILRSLVFGTRFSFQNSSKKRFLVLGESDEFKRIKTLILQNLSSIEYVHGLCIHVSYPESKGTVDSIYNKVDFSDYDEVIFSAKDLEAAQIIKWMTEIKHPHLDFKIAQPDVDYLIGSNSIDTMGELYRVNINNLTQPENLRSKRFFDAIVSLFLIALSPLVVWFQNNKTGFFTNVVSVLFGQKSWVGFYTTHQGFVDPQLPSVKKGVLNPMDYLPYAQEQHADKFNLIYARDYSILKDLGIILRSFRQLGR